MVWQREIAWKRFDERGEERCGFACDGDVCGAEGVGAVAINGSGLVFQYRIELSAGWQVIRAGIVTRLGSDEFTTMLERREGSWSVGGVLAPQFDECEDIDLAFSPSTNSITLKRLSLEVGERISAKAILVTEPELSLKVIEQTYRRLDRSRYEYQSGNFNVVIEVDDDGLVTDYPGMFQSLAQTVTR